MKLQVLFGDDFRLNEKVHNEIIRLAKASYKNPAEILYGILPSYDTVYLARDDNDHLAAFFMFCIEGLTVGDESMPAIHLGWTCAAQESKGTGAAQAIYKQFIADSRAREQSAGKRFLLWSSTMTPVGVHLYQKYFADVIPDTDGNFPIESIKIAEALYKRYSMGTADSHPFVLRGGGRARFSDAERERIYQIAAGMNFTLFEKLGIDDRNGDLLLVICRLPS